MTNKTHECVVKEIQRILANTELSKAQVQTVRLKLLKIGARISETTLNNFM